MSEQKYHISVMLREAVDALNIKEDGIYADVTFGGGGHSTEILKHLKTGHLFAFDQDIEAFKNAPLNDHITTIHSNFKFIRNYLDYFKVIPIDGILADLGISSHHIDEKSRGFSYAPGTILDMRMNPKAALTAAEILNTYSAESIAKILNEYGDVRKSYEIARKIVSSRIEKPFNVSDDLHHLLQPYIIPGRENRLYSQIFQALRMEVNDEPGALQSFLDQAYEVLKPGGRLVIITFHSVEDRIVKNFFKSVEKTNDSEAFLKGIQQNRWILPEKKAITPSEEELSSNNRSRSAQLRVAIKK